MKENIKQTIQLYRKESDNNYKELENETNSSSDLSYLDSIEEMNREVMRFKNQLDNMWFQNNGQKIGFNYTKANLKYRRYF